MIDAMIALDKFRKIVIVLPTLALIDETRRRIAQKFRSRCHLITHPSQVAVSDKTNVYILAAEALRHGVGLHHGGIPRALQQHMVRMFNDGSIRVLICTSTLIEGVNTVAKNVIVYDRRRNRNVLDFFTYKNIQGRAGRMGTYFVGKVFMLERPPENEDVIVEYPIGGQNEDTPLSLLLQLDESELSERSRERVNDAIESSFLSADTLRANGSVLPDTQNRIARAVHDRLVQGDALLLWRGFPQRDQLVAVCDLIVADLSGPRLKDLDIKSGKGLAWHLNALGMSRGLSGYLREIAVGVLPGQSVSDRIDNALKIVRNIATFQFPRDLMVLHRIVSEVADRLELSSPDYTVYAEATEHLFLPAPIAALDEYGIPNQIARKLIPYLDQYDLDRALQDLRAVDVNQLTDFSDFERSLVTVVQPTI
ncbi:hypothetical protein ACVI1L_003142 [Bradyrhizobium sp. USDA 4516]